MLLLNYKEPLGIFPFQAFQLRPVLKVNHGSHYTLIALTARSNLIGFLIVELSQ